MIAFDIDGCVNNMKADLLRFGREHFQRFEVTFQPDAYYLRDMFSGAPEEAYQAFWNAYGYDIFTAPPREHVQETLRFLRERNLDACYITNRDVTRIFNGIPFDELTKRWLNAYGISLPVWFQRDKAALAKSLGVRLMVEDKPGNILSLQEVTKVLIFRHPYNAEMEGTFVESWEEIEWRVKSEEWRVKSGE